MAITGVVDSNGKNVKRGTWQFSLDNGTNWNDIVGVSATNALVLPDDGNARIRFLPIKKTKGFFSISYRAWDQSNAATPGSLVDPSGDAAFSSTIERAWVGLGKTKPVVNEFGQTVLRAVKEDRKASRVFQVKAVLGIAGLETPANFGIAIVAASTSDGHWEYRLAKSKAWVAVDNVSASSALLLGPKDKLRFFPNANADGEGSISFLTWNETGGTTGSKVDPTGDPAFGTDPGTATLDIIAINDAPTLTPIVSTLNSVAPGETTNEVVFASLFTGTDVEGVAIGVAITSISGKGIWEYRSAGGQWTLIERASGRRPLLLEADAELRFTADVNAKPGKAKLSFKSWDKTLGTSGNTEKAGRLSKATAKLSVTIG